jgi:hypothetical protein
MRSLEAVTKEDSMLNYADLSDSLIDALPELREQYRAMLSDWAPQTPGPHIVFGDLLTPWVIELLGNPSANSERLEFLCHCRGHPGARRATRKGGCRFVIPGRLGVKQPSGSSMGLYG